MLNFILGDFGLTSTSQLYQPPVVHQKTRVDLKEYQEIFLSPDVTPRFNLKTDHPVELFYKRHMNNDQPIPQVIVVGILRVLLTTCPNNQRNAGGIDLHAEWSSCLNFLILHKDYFKEMKFKSKAFEKTDTLLDFVPKNKRQKNEGEQDG